jgi:hypothetical protein
MSRTRFLIAFSLLVSLGLFGMWLGRQTRDSWDPTSLLGLLLVAGAVVGLIVAFRRDLREPEEERRAEWERTQAKGRLRHVLIQVGLGAFVWGLFLLISLLVDVYRGGEYWGAALQYLGRHAALGALVAAICGLWALVWWSRQERKYRGEA